MVVYTENLIYIFLLFFPPHQGTRETTTDLGGGDVETTRAGEDQKRTGSHSRRRTQSKGRFRRIV